MENANKSFVSSLFGTREGVSAIKDKIEKHRDACKADAIQIRFDQLNLWLFDASKNLVHASGKFFSIEALSVIYENVQEPTYKVIINQPEVGILGIIATEFNKQLFFLMQCKYEPGNIDKVQLSPTVQATQSNYTAVHKGKSVPYIDYFFSDQYSLFDIPLSEQGGRFFKKKNKNVIKIIQETEIEAKLYSDDFVWVSLHQLLALIKLDNYVNMNTRSIISGVDYNYFSDKPVSVADAESLYAVLSNGYGTNFGSLFFTSAQNIEPVQYSYVEIVNWINKKKEAARIIVKKIPLIAYPNLRRDDVEIVSCEKMDFSVIAVNVIAEREVSAWTQPIVKDHFDRLHGLIAKKMNGVLHFLVKLQSEVGNSDGPEVGPTILGDPLQTLSVSNTKYVHYFSNPLPENIMLSVMQSDEGGRFFRVQNKHVIVYTDDEILLESDDYKWLTLFQIKKLIRSGLVCIELRSIVSCINFLE